MTKLNFEITKSHRLASLLFTASHAHQPNLECIRIRKDGVADATNGRMLVNIEPNENQSLPQETLISGIEVDRVFKLAKRDKVFITKTGDKTHIDFVGEKSMVPNAVLDTHKTEYPDVDEVRPNRDKPAIYEAHITAEILEALGEFVRRSVGSINGSPITLKFYGVKDGIEWSADKTTPDNEKLSGIIMPCKGE